MSSQYLRKCTVGDLFPTSTIHFHPKNLATLEKSQLSTGERYEKIKLSKKRNMFLQALSLKPHTHHVSPPPRKPPTPLDPKPLPKISLTKSHTQRSPKRSLRHRNPPPPNTIHSLLTNKFPLATNPPRSALSMQCSLSMLHSWAHRWYGSVEG